MERVTEIGVRAAVGRLLPSFVHASQVAIRIQAGLLDGSISNPYAKDHDDAFVAALTPADLVVEDMIGAELLRRFSDVAFYGEEHALDHVSIAFPSKAPFTVTLDPINGTKYFLDGVPQWDMIMTICQGTIIHAAVVYLPSSERFFIGIRQAGAFTLTAKQALAGGDTAWQPFVLPDAERVVQVRVAGTRSVAIANTLGNHGFRAVNPRVDYVDKDRTWKYSTHGILTGTLAGFIKEGAQLIDTGAIAMIASEAGGFLTGNVYNAASRRANLICGTSQQAHDAIYRAMLHAPLPD